MDEYFVADLSFTCLGCICEAASNCNLTIGCRGRLCGPFLVAKEYWEDAGKPVLDGDISEKEGAYERCVNDPYCAAETVKRYVYRFAQVGLSTWNIFIWKMTFGQFWVPKAFIFFEVDAMQISSIFLQLKICNRNSNSCRIANKTLK